MNLQLAFKAMQFHRVRSRLTLQLLFIGLLAFRAFASLCPWCNRDFSFVQKALEQMQNGVLPSLHLSSGHIWTIALNLTAYALAFFVAYYYALLLTLEWQGKVNDYQKQDLYIFDAWREQVLALQEGLRDDLQSRHLLQELDEPQNAYVWQDHTVEPEHDKGTRDCEAERQQWERLAPAIARPALGAFKLLVRAFPSAFLFLLLLLFVIAVVLPLAGMFSTMLFFILACMFLFAPLDAAFLKIGLGRALALSRRKSYGVKMLLFMQGLLPILFVNIFNLLPLLFFGEYFYSAALMDALIFAVSTLIIGRVWAMFYRIYAFRGACPVSEPLT